MDEIIQVNTSGFYKLDGELLYAPNFVLNQNYELKKETHADYTYPMDGWRWFETLEAANEFHGIVQEIAVDFDATNYDNGIS